MSLFSRQNFVSEMYRVTESAGRVEAGPGWGWVSKYTQATSGSGTAGWSSAVAVTHSCSVN